MQQTIRRLHSEKSWWCCVHRILGWVTIYWCDVRFIPAVYCVAPSMVIFCIDMMISYLKKGCWWIVCRSMAQPFHCHTELRRERVLIWIFNWYDWKILQIFHNYLKNSDKNAFVEQQTWIIHNNAQPTAETMPNMYKWI